jgi:hypothetical protein
MFNFGVGSKTVKVNKPYIEFDIYNNDTNKDEIWKMDVIKHSRAFGFKGEFINPEHKYQYFKGYTLLERILDWFV